MKEISDEELVKEFVNGKRDSLEKLYFRYKDKLIRLIWYYVNNTEDAEDILQTVFEKLIKSIKKYTVHRDASFKTYLYRIAINSSKDFLKHKRILQFIKFDGIKYIGEYDKNIQFAEDNIIVEKVREYVNRLPSKYRDVIVLKYYEDLKYKEIAKILKKPVGTVKSRLSYALNLVRNNFKELENGK